MNLFKALEAASLRLQTNDPEFDSQANLTTDILRSAGVYEPPHLNWSSAMFRKRRTDNDEQTTEAGRDYHEVEAS